jgi:hypothetical protein
MFEIDNRKENLKFNKNGIYAFLEEEINGESFFKLIKINKRRNDD